MKIVRKTISLEISVEVFFLEYAVMLKRSLTAYCYDIPEKQPIIFAG